MKTMTYICGVLKNKIVMEKLKLEHLAPYLPYGLKGINNGSTCNIVGIFTPSEEVIIQIGCIHYVNPKNVKPILRPLSDLTKEIEHKGVSFVPWVEINKFLNGGKFQAHYNVIEYNEYDSLTIDFGDHCAGYSLNLESLPVIQMLLKWRFDVFGLIEKGLAIDINTCKF